jgi:hypothetical protein
MSLRRDALPRVQRPCSPSQLVHLALIGPFIRRRNQLVPHGIAAHILPLIVVAFASAQLAIPMMTLPDTPADLAQIARGNRFPISHPNFERGRVEAARCTEEMEVIWHEHVSAHEPGGRVFPCPNDRRMRFRCGEDRSSLHGARGNENYDCPIVGFDRSKMNRMFSIDGRAISERRASARLWFRGIGIQARTCGSTSLRGFHRRSHGEDAIRLVISTASSSAAVASNPETFGRTPVRAHSMKERIWRLSGSSFSISTSARSIPPPTLR